MRYDIEFVAGSFGLLACIASLQQQRVADHRQRAGGHVDNTNYRVQQADGGAFVGAGDHHHDVEARGHA